MAHAQPLGVKGEVRIEEPDALQRTVARRTAEARATIPQIEMSAEVEMTAALEVRDRERCSLTALLVRACALSLREIPFANGAYRDGRFELYSRINVGVVVAAGDIYAIPTVFDADRKALAELTTEIDALSRQARERTLSSPAFAGATFTLWNAGAQGVTSAGIVINPPQACALAAGLIREAPALRDGTLTTARPMTVTLACDHRIIYGERATGLISALRLRLEEPGTLDG
jgi:pyruvate dehydrogenase E2 component (dihydrolipoamide acetyltransferase)